MTDVTCTAGDCPGPVFCRGWCVKHYNCWRRHGDPLYVRTKKPCGAGDCDRLARSNGFCHRHAENLRNYGDPVPQRDRPLEVRLHEIGWTVIASDCWEWDGPRNENGYGLFSARRLGYEGARAHRVVYEWLAGLIPDGLILRHTCDNPPCVNPEHQLPGTPLDNMRDMVKRRRHWRHGRVSCDNGHDLTLLDARTSQGWCKVCDRARKRRYEQRKREERAA